MATDLHGKPIPVTHYATLEDSPGFSVVISRVGKRFKLKYSDTRSDRVSQHQVFTKWWETQAAADEYIKIYSQMKGRTINDNSHRQGKSRQRRAGK